MREIVDSRFGEVSLWTKKEGQGLLLMTQESLDSSEECDFAVETVRERLEMNHDYIMKAVDFSVHVRALNHFQIAVYYEAPLKDLKQEISSRKLENR